LVFYSSFIIMMRGPINIKLFIYQFINYVEENSVGLVNCMQCIQICLEIQRTIVKR
jgi:hypothetical protein